MTATTNEVTFLENACKRIQQNLPGIRFVGVINQLGHLVAGGFRDNVVPYVSSNREYMMYMGFVLELNMRKEFDDALGQVNYLHSKRDKVSMISMPMGRHMVLLATETDVDVPKIVNKVKKEFLDLKMIKENLKPIIEIV